MIIVVDESVDSEIVSTLRQDGHGVDYIAETAPGSTDHEVLRNANQRSALLITADKDFGELVFRLQQVHAGILLLRLAGLLANDKSKIVSQALRDHGLELAGAFSVLSPGALRIRR